MTHSAPAGVFYIKFRKEVVHLPEAHRASQGYAYRVLSVVFPNFRISTLAASDQILIRFAEKN